MIKNPKLKKGQIWWVQLSYSSSDTVGHEQAHKRPCIILKTNKHVKLNTILPLTSNKNASRFPYTYIIKKTRANKLDTDSVALIFPIRTLSYKRFENFIGYISREELERIKILLKDYLFG